MKHRFNEAHHPLWHLIGHSAETVLALRAGRRGLPCNLAFGTPLGPSAMWVPLPNRHPINVKNGFATATIMLIR